MPIDLKIQLAHTLSVLFEILAIVGAACFVLALGRIIWKEFHQ